jgi:hypothetical protein
MGIVCLYQLCQLTVYHSVITVYSSVTVTIACPIDSMCALSHPCAFFFYIFIIKLY